MKKIILPLAIILVLILSIVIISFTKNDEQPIENPSEIQNNINENNEKPKEETNAVSVYDKYNIDPGSYEAYLLNQYSGDPDFISEDLDGDGLPDGIFKEEMPIS